MSKGLATAFRRVQAPPRLLSDQPKASAINFITRSENARMLAIRSPLPVSSVTAFEKPGPVTAIPAHLSQHACAQLQSVEHERQILWQAWLRKLDRIDPSYRN